MVDDRPPTPAEALIELRAEWRAAADPDERATLAEIGRAVKIIAEILDTVDNPR